MRAEAAGCGPGLGEKTLPPAPCGPGTKTRGSFAEGREVARGTLNGRSQLHPTQEPLAAQAQGLSSRGLSSGHALWGCCPNTHQLQSPAEQCTLGSGATGSSGESGGPMQQPRAGARTLGCFRLQHPRLPSHSFPQHTHSFRCGPLGTPRAPGPDVTAAEPPPAPSTAMALLCRPQVSVIEPADISSTQQGRETWPLRAPTSPAGQGMEVPGPWGLTWKPAGDPQVPPGRLPPLPYLLGRPRPCSALGVCSGPAGPGAPPPWPASTLPPLALSQLLL